MLDGVVRTGRRGQRACWEKSLDTKGDGGGWWGNVPEEEPELRPEARNKHSMKGYSGLQDRKDEGSGVFCHFGGLLLFLFCETRSLYIALINLEPRR